MAKGKKNTGLGRGLGALLHNEEELSSNPIGLNQVLNTENIGEIEIDKIEVNPFQPRTDFDQEAMEELASSIAKQGIIQPVTVRKLSGNEYQLISGERRIQASRLAGLEKVPAYIRSADDQQMLEMALIENIQRENLNPMEISLSYQRLITEIGLHQEQLGDRVGKKRTTVNNYLRLLKLPPDIQAALRDKKISMGHAKAILSIDDVEQQLNLFNKVIKDNISVRKTEELARLPYNNSPTETPLRAETRDREITRVQNRLSSHFGTQIRIKSDAKNKGEIKIPFFSTNDLNRILEILES